jgi:hypothetical protein
MRNTHTPQLISIWENRNAVKSHTAQPSVATLCVSELRTNCPVVLRVSDMLKIDRCNLIIMQVCPKGVGAPKLEDLRYQTYSTSHPEQAVSPNKQPLACWDPHCRAHTTLKPYTSVVKKLRLSVLFEVTDYFILPSPCPLAVSPRAGFAPPGFRCGPDSWPHTLAHLQTCFIAASSPTRKAYAHSNPRRS